MPILTKYRVLLFLILITMSIACKKEATKTSDTEPENDTLNGTTQIDTVELTIARGGGFTGLYKGYTLHSDGQVVHWQRFGAGPDSVLWKAQDNSGKIHDFVNQLEESEVLTKNIQETGNITTIVTLELPDTSHTWSWPGSGVNDSTPDIFKEWYSLVENYCRTLKE